ncbi:hypothetical protein J4230_00425 [Candidatus Woesearchaeota archaeon]|nr:hypothetical protein [Candidatus Woesearchaeota archaeon]
MSNAIGKIIGLASLTTLLCLEISPSFNRGVDEFANSTYRLSPGCAYYMSATDPKNLLYTAAGTGLVGAVVGLVYNSLKKEDKKDC